MICALLSLILAVMPPRETPVVDHVDCIELNHCHGSDGTLVLDQVIFWEFCPWDGKDHVVAYRILREVRDNGDVVNGIPKWIGGHAAPLKNHKLGLWVSRWLDKKDGIVLREVRAPHYFRSTTWWDPETEDRHYLQSSHRRGLTPKVSGK